MKKKKNKVAPNYLFILVILYLVVTLYLKTDATYMKFLTICIIGVVVSGLHVILVKPHLSFSIKDDTRVRINKKEGVELILSIQNKSWLQSPYIYIFLKPTYHVISKQYKSICMTLPPLTTKEIVIDYIGEYSGKDFMGIEEIVVQDYFGLIKWRIICCLQKEVNVLPQAMPLGKMEYLLNRIKVKAQAEDQIPVISSDGEVCHELAPYVEGDSLKLMHWKLLARRDIYMVRQREEHVVIKREYLFILDPICEETEEENRAKLVDKVLVACISCAYAFLKQEEKVTLIYKEENAWKQFTLSEITAVEQLATLLSSYTGRGGRVGEERWPYAYLKQNYPFEISKLFLTLTLSRNLGEQLEDEKYLNILEMKRSPWSGEGLLNTWYLAEEFEVKRYV